MSKKKETQETAVVPAQTQAVSVASGYEDFQGQGFEGQSSADIAIPFLLLLQSNSPVVEDGKAKAGQFRDTVTEEVFDSVDIIPVYTEHAYIEYVPRDKGGGFVARHEPGSAAVREGQRREGSAKLFTPDGNELVENFLVFGLRIIDDENAMMAAIPFYSTKIRKYKKWNSLLQTCTVKVGDRKLHPPLFAHRSRFTSEKEKNNLGTFYNFAISPTNATMLESLMPVDHPLFVAAHEYYKLIREGKAKVNYNDVDRGDDDRKPEGGGSVPF